MLYEKGTVNEIKNEVIVVNLRSDTFTKPSLKMRQAMFDAEVGDDVVGEDPTVNSLEKFAAELLGMEAAIFVTSGSMGNLISIMIHCDQRGCEVYLGEECHIVQHEQGSAAQIAGATICTLPNNHDGTFDLNKLEHKLRNPTDIHHPISRMIAVENTINGKVLPVDWLKKIVAFAKHHKLKLHMDGARLWNAVAASKVDVKKIVEGFDSVSFCLSKGLGGPVGSILCGSKDFINQARRCRKILGGGMRQIGILAAAGFIALENRLNLHKDHDNATNLMVAINNVNSNIITVDPATVQSNMIFVTVKGSAAINANTVVKRLAEVVDEHEDDQIIIQAWAIWHESFRLVIHRDITDVMMNAAKRKIVYVIKKLDPSSVN